MSPRRLPKLRPLSRRDILTVVLEEFDACDASCRRLDDQITIEALASLRRCVVARILEPTE